jgi:hypothetical protein
MYFSFDLNGDGYIEHSTEKEAKELAEVVLNIERDEAMDGEWDESVENIRWGKIIGKPFLKEQIYAEDSDYELREI